MRRCLAARLVNNFWKKILRFRRNIPMRKRDMNYTNSEYLEHAGKAVVTLDSEAVALPAGRSSLSAIRSYLETVALAKQRVLSEFSVDGCPIDLSLPLEPLSFRRVDAATVPLNELPLLLLTTAGHQVNRAHAAVETALTLVLINNAKTARELWWNIACNLKEPVLTLSLMPEHLCQAWCGTTFHKLRRWQLEQVAAIVRRVDDACESQDNIRLSDALEKLVLPWLEKLREHIGLWLDATRAGARLGVDSSAV